MNKIHYRACYRYQLTRDYHCETGLSVPHRIESTYLELTTSGRLLIRDGYAWDGASLHAQSIMRASLVLDALYQLIRENHLPRSADLLFHQLCKEDGMSDVRALQAYQIVRSGEGPFKNRHPTHAASSFDGATDAARRMPHI